MKHANAIVAFEKEFGSLVDTTKNENGSYADVNTEFAYHVFLKTLNSRSGRISYILSNILTKFKKALGSETLYAKDCVIGRMRNDGTPMFSQNPKAHYTIATAVAERDRLTNIHPNEQFCIYVRLPTIAEKSEMSGDARHELSFALERLSKFFKTHEMKQSYGMVPYSVEAVIGLDCYLVKYYNEDGDTDTTTHKTPFEAAKAINEWVYRKERE